MHLWEQPPSEQFPSAACCPLWLPTVSPAADTLPGTQETLDKSVLKVSALF